MKLVPLVLLVLGAVVGHADASTAEDSVLRCHSLGDIIPTHVNHSTPVDCTCDGPRYIALGPVRIGSPGGGNGNIQPDCYFSTEVIPAHYDAEPGGRYDLQPIMLPVEVVLRRCDTSDCYIFWGSASCVIERTVSQDCIQSYRVVGSCQAASGT
ncbi:MAG: hypothetical protein VX460_10230 [Planctomycetota bacterium]|nr:hypothetical protein [Planctomycetota bacterium]